MKSFTVFPLLFVVITTCFSQQTVPDKRAHHALIYDENSETVKLIGGSTPLNNGSSFQFFDDVWSFDGRSWKKDNVVSDQRSGVSLAYDPKNKSILSLGGFTSNGQSKSDLRELKDNKWTTLTDLPELTMTEGAFVYDSKNDRFVAFGGGVSRGQVNSTTWVWDRKSWKKLEGAGPEGRQAFVMVYDSERSKIVLFGGMGATPQTLYGDTWELDGDKWTKVSTSGPAPRMSMGYAYDSKRGLLMIFGGASANGILSDMWIWGEGTWEEHAINGPDARMMGYMAYDKKRDKVVLFGGRLSWPNDINDTWIWDGVSWRKP